MAKQLVSSADAKPRARQHKKPCSDCPFSRKSLRGWLGGLSVLEWLGIVRSDGKEMCHTCGNQQCAGLAIFRANVCKSPRDKTVLELPADRTLVFSNYSEFEKHRLVTHPTSLSDSTPCGIATPQSEATSIFECEHCGTPDILPSGRCAHCNLPDRRRLPASEGDK